MDLTLTGIKQGSQGWSLYSSPYIIANQQAIIESSHALHRRYQEHVQTDPGRNSTKDYRNYNVFALAPGNAHYYYMYKMIQAVSQPWTQNQPSWIMAWLNYHKPDEVLGWHDHLESTAHGYISIDPHDTATEFEQFTIENSVGQIYAGPCGLRHRVVVRNTFDRPRITLAFQVSTISDFYEHTKLVDSEIPI